MCNFGLSSLIESYNRESVSTNSLNLIKLINSALPEIMWTGEDALEECCWPIVFSCFDTMFCLLGRLRGSEGKLRQVHITGSYY